MKPDLLALYDQEMRVQIEFPGERREAFPGLVRHVRPAPRANTVLYTRLEEGSAEAVIAEQVADLKALGQPFSWKVFEHDLPADLGDRLQRHGLQPEDPGAIMVLELGLAPAPLLQVPTVDVRRIITREQLADVIAVEQQVWGRDFAWLEKQLWAQMEVPGYTSVYAAYAQGEPVCSGWTFFHPDSAFASIWGGSTVARHRKQGYYTAILAARAQEALQRGYRYLVIDAGPMSQPLVAKLGFERLTGVVDYAWPGSGEAA